MSDAGWAIALTPLVALLACVGLYPLTLLLLSRRHCFANPSRAPGSAAERPTIIVTCHNEGAELPGAIDALLTQRGLVSPEIVVASDASTDDTDEIALSYRTAGVTLHRHDARAGKTGVENSLIGTVTGEVIFFMDAASRPAPDAVDLMLRAFEDPQVGIVSSRDASPDRDANVTTAGTEATYLSYEMWLRDLESRTGGIVGASGSLYALRRELFIELAPHTTRDFASVLLAQHGGFKAIAVPACCIVRPAADFSAERKRRARTMAQGMATLLHYRRWIHPLGQPVFALKLFCHKVARWLLIPAAVLGVLGVVAALVATGDALRFIGWSIALLSSTALLEYVLVRRGYLTVPWVATAVAGVLAGLASWARLFVGRRTVSWDPTRR